MEKISAGYSKENLPVLLVLGDKLMFDADDFHGVFDSQGWVTSGTMAAVQQCYRSRLPQNPDYIFLAVENVDLDVLNGHIHEHVRHHPCRSFFLVESGNYWEAEADIFHREPREQTLGPSTYVSGFKDDCVVRQLERKTDGGPNTAED